MRLTVHVDQGEVGARVDHALSNHQSQASRTTGDETDVAVEGEAGEGGLDVLASHATNGLAGRQLVLIWVLDLNIGVGTRVATRLVETRRCS